MANQTSQTWTSERVEQLQAGIDEGLTFVQIAARMGLTKNQCLCKATRMGMRPRADAPPSTAQISAREGRLARAVSTVERLAALPRFPPHGGCVFPGGNPGEEGFHFCCEPVAIVGAPYCSRHMARAYLPAGRAQLAMVKLGNVVQLRKAV